MKKISLKTAIEKVLTSKNIVSREPIYETYDKNVQGNTAWERGYAACSMTTCFRDFEELEDVKSSIAVSISGGGNPNLAKIDPKMAAESAVSEAVFLQSCVGATPLAATDCLNFGNPEKEDQMGELVDGINGVKEACERLKVPIVSGNVSLYNESAGKSIPPNAIISLFGRVDKVEKVKPMAFCEKGLSIFVLGRRSKNLGGSEFFRVFEQEDSRFPEINYEKFSKLSEKIKESVLGGNFSSITPIVRGGAIVSVLTAAFKNNIGAEISLPKEESVPEFLFSEDFGAVITTNNPSKIKDIFGESAVEIGKTIEGNNLIISQNNEKLLDQGLDEWKSLWEDGLRSIF